MSVPAKRGGRGKGFFPKVKEAREALAGKAVDLFNSYMALAVAAQAAEKFEVAEKILWNLMSHMPEDEETGTLLTTSVDIKKEVESGPTGPSIQIGLALGGMPPQASLPELPRVVEIKRGGPPKAQIDNQ